MPVHFLFVIFGQLFLIFFPPRSSAAAKARHKIPKSPMEQFIESVHASVDDVPFTPEGDNIHEQTMMSYDVDDPDMQDVDAWESVSVASMPVVDPPTAVKNSQANISDNLSFIEYLEAHGVSVHDSSSSRRSTSDRVRAVATGGQVLIQNQMTEPSNTSAFFSQQGSFHHHPSTSQASSPNLHQPIADPEAALKQLMAFTNKRGLSARESTSSRTSSHHGSIGSIGTANTDAAFFKI